MINRSLKFIIVFFFVISLVIVNHANLKSQIYSTTPFEKSLPEFERPDNTSVESLQAEVQQETIPKLDTLYVDPASKTKSYIYKPIH